MIKEKKNKFVMAFADNPYTQAGQDFDCVEAKAIYVYKRAMRHTFFMGIAIVLLVISNFVVYIFASNKPPITAMWEVNDVGKYKLISDIDPRQGPGEKQRQGIKIQHIYYCVNKLFNLGINPDIVKRQLQQDILGSDKLCFTLRAIKSQNIQNWFTDIANSFPENRMLWKSHTISSLDIYPVMGVPDRFEIRFRKQTQSVSGNVLSNVVYRGEVETLPWGEGKINAYRNPFGVWVDSIIWYPDNTAN
jgi:hypothetical protein